MVKLSDEQILQVVRTISQKHGCRIKQVDFKAHKIDLDGPPDAQDKCEFEIMAFLN